MSFVQVHRWDGSQWVREGSAVEMSDEQLAELRIQADALNRATMVAQSMLAEMRGGLDEIARTSGQDAETIERAAIQLFRANALLDPEYDGWWVESETVENWRTLMIESERDRYREVAAQLVAVSGGGWPC